ncbi:unnamed protein product [Schistosoma margrebowiei]|uniref:Uncharacterized protein n=1 Tax=Schistosoma margrebowiei TaxID=48269 RepID=A0A183MTZ1_9TREM|nr:unnamed protein product [Schistosoma margrebowiei]
MCETRKTSQIAAEMRKYSVTVFRIRETHWIQAEQKRLGTEEMLLYSDHAEENALHTKGVSLTKSEEAIK